MIVAICQHIITHRFAFPDGVNDQMNVYHRKFDRINWIYPSWNELCLDESVIIQSLVG